MIFVLIRPPVSLESINCVNIFDFGWALPKTPLESLKHSPDSLVGFKGPTSDGRGGAKGRGEGKGRGGGEKRREEERHGPPHPY